MERALVAEDPKLASTLRGTKMRQQAKRQLILGIIAFIIGVAALMAGAVLSLIPLGVAGFVIMLGSAYLSLTSWKGHTRNLSGTTPPTGETTGLRVVQGGGR